MSMLSFLLLPIPCIISRELQYDAFTKICWINIKLAFQMLNATPRYIFSHRWGYRRNGQWSGMVDDLLSGRADVGTNLLMTVDRLDVITYTEGLSPYRVRFIFRQPPLSYVANIFSLPFSSGVWIATVVCAIVSTIALYLASKWEVAIGKSPTHLDGFGDSLFLTMSAVSQQGCIMEPKKISGRIIMLFVFVSLMALYTAYSANIVVLLQAPSNSIRTLSQLARSKVTIAANDVDYNHIVFKLFKDPVRVSIQKKLEPENGKAQFYDMNEGVERIRQGLFAFHSIVEPVYRRIEKTFLETEKCDLTEVDFLNSLDPFTPIKKHSPYTELLRVVIKQIRESGILSAVYKRLQVPKPRCTEKVSAFSSVGLLDLRAVMFLMLIGAAVSIGVMFIEIIFHKLNKRQRGI
uniref:Ionotropic receptor n=1 Tax=Eogystia hippophaecolus TaxID=1206364 RepID=A0A1B3P5I3_EOGHI|nr:ionotropic receptor [Eogystia hippophaecolus]